MLTRRLYRKHCANRTHRLRSTLKITHGKGREFKKTPPITQDNIKDGQFVSIIVSALFFHLMAR